MESARSFLTPKQGLEYALAAAAVLVAGMAFAATFDSALFVLPITLAAAAATAVSLLCRRWKLPASPALMVSLCALIIVGSGLVARRVPPLGIAAFLGFGVRGWRLMLDQVPPYRAAGQWIAVPFIVAWVGAAVAAELVGRTKSTVLPLVGPFGALAMVILFGIRAPQQNLWVGAGLFALSVTFVAIRGITGREAGKLRINAGVIVAVCGVVAAGAVAPTVARHLPFAAAAHEYTLHDGHIPIADPRSLASPLARLKEAVDPQLQDKAQFEVEGSGFDRFTLATLSDYRGEVWSLSSQVKPELVSASANLPSSERSGAKAKSFSAKVTVRELGGNWIPTPGMPTRVLAGDGLSQNSIRYDSIDGNVFAYAGLKNGAVYQVEGDLVESYNLGSATSDAVDLRDPKEFSAFRNVALKVVGAEKDPARQLVALAEWLRRGGYDDTAKAGHTADVLLKFLGQDSPAGYTEQFAAGFAAAARSLGINVRVVVGFKTDGRTVVKMSDLTAWNEVRLRSGDWQWIDTKPQQNRTAVEDPHAASGSAGAKLPPPLGVDEVPTTVASPKSNSDTDKPPSTKSVAGGFHLTPIAGTALGGVTVALLAALFALVVVLLKRRRKRRRRAALAPHAQIAGAWWELVDRNRDHGYAPKPGATLREGAVGLADFAGITPDEVARFSSIVERSTFDLDEPSPEQADEVWQEFERVAQLLDTNRSTLERIRGRIRVTSLR